MEGPYESGNKAGSARPGRSAVNGGLADSFQEADEFFAR
jgi:hypothetical protein